MESRLKAEGKKRPYVKVQTTGPLSFALTVTDENKRAIYYNEEFRDVIIKALGMKCRWQIQKFKPYGEQIICFIDEPILSAFGSSTYVSVKREDVVAHLKEVIEAVHAEGGLAGIHCCGNTEWSILVDAGVDILNFDAFGYGETIGMYPQAMKTLLERGGAIAWGVVPTSPAIREQTPEKLAAHFEKMADNLASKGIDKKMILEQAIITPSCGTGSLEVADGEKVFQTLRAVSQSLRAKHGYLMSYTIAITGKGGVGKTTVAALVVRRLIASGRRPVLAVDADPNTCLDIALGVKVEHTVGGVREEARVLANEGTTTGVAKQELMQLKIAQSLVESSRLRSYRYGSPGRSRLLLFCQQCLARGTEGDRGRLSLCGAGQRGGPGESLAADCAGAGPDDHGGRSLPAGLGNRAAAFGPGARDADQGEAACPRDQPLAARDAAAPRGGLAGRNRRHADHPSGG